MPLDYSSVIFLFHFVLTSEKSLNLYFVRFGSFLYFYFRSIRFIILFRINWSIHPDLLVRKYDFPTFEKFLECNEVKEYIEISGFTDKGGIVYSAKSFPQNEHILRRINDEKLTAEQRSLNYFFCIFLIFFEFLWNFLWK